MLLRAGAERSKEAAEQERMLKAIELGDLRGEMEELIKGSQEWEDRIVSSSIMSRFTFMMTHDGHSHLTHDGSSTAVITIEVPCVSSIVSSFT